MINLLSESTIDLAALLQTVLNWLSTEGVKLLIGLVVLFFVFKIINIIAKKFKKTMLAKNRDKTITMVVYSIIRKGLKAIAFLAFLGYVGIDTAGIGTIIASAGVAVGLALQGSLSNLAGGIVILLMRPFKIGDYITAQGESGTVEEIKLFYSYLITPDNKVIMIPNGVLANGSIINYSTKEFRRVDFEFSISYDEDFEKAKKVIWDVIVSIENILTDPSPFVRVVSKSSS